MWRADDDSEDESFEGEAANVSPECFNRRGAWHLARFLTDDNTIEEDDYTVTRVIEVLAELQLAKYEEFCAVVLRFGVVDGFRYSLKSVARVFRNTEQYVLKLLAEGVTFLLDQLTDWKAQMST